jgi:phosphate transporter
LLSEHQPTETDAAFAPLLDLELKKIIFFYETQSKELFDELEELEEAVRQQEELGLLGLSRYEDYSEGEDDEDDDSISRSPTRAARRSSVNRTLSRQRRATLSTFSYHSQPKPSLIRVQAAMVLGALVLALATTTLAMA